MENQTNEAKTAIIKRAQELINSELRAEFGELLVYTVIKRPLCLGFSTYWSTKHCIVQDKKLKLYNDKIFNQLYCVLDFNLLTCSLETRDNERNLTFKIKVLNTNFELLLKSEDEEQYNTWIKAISSNINRSIGSQQQLTTISQSPNFWQIDRITIESLAYEGDTGDILLFQGKQWRSKLNQFL